MPVYALSVAIAALLIGRVDASEGSRRPMKISQPKAVCAVRAVADNVIRIDYRLEGQRGAPTMVLDPKGLRTKRARTESIQGGFKTKSVEVQETAEAIVARHGSVKISIDRDELAKGLVRILHAEGENLYGMRATKLFLREDEPKITPDKGLLRNEGSIVRAGAQGDGGAPLVYTTNWGVLIDSVDGEFTTKPGEIVFKNGSRKDFEIYVILGKPKEIIERITELSGRPPLMPKWSLGFMNSQWGDDEDSVYDIVKEYRKRKIPIDAFIFDFDFKAWGEDDFGEFRWNSTSGAGAVKPNKFPDGASGKFAANLAKQGVKCVGIMKPRILTQNVELKPTKAAAEATANGWWMPGKKPYKDYFSNRLANDLDFSKADLRKWYWKHAKQLFDTGIHGWWNDEADDWFPTPAFAQMQQSLYEGQRSASNLRVWSINRNSYLGGQRYAYGVWSGDIRTGFPSMKEQPIRMLATLNLGQPHWSMDSGGFNGKPGEENYARWIQLASLVPIMRVHGSYGQRRQPWIYGDLAEGVAKKAIEWRYSMIPTLYSLEYGAHLTGVGMVRPMFWEFPDDQNTANLTDQWMIGDGLLAAPVLDKGIKRRELYLPEGNWFRYSDDKLFKGGRTVRTAVDSETWADVPLFVRGGTILATQPVQQYVGEKPVEEITLDIWPDQSRLARFDLYEDDGATYDYEKGSSSLREFRAKASGSSVWVTMGEPKGPYRSELKRIRLKIHGEFKKLWVNRQETEFKQVSPGISEVLVLLK